MSEKNGTRTAPKTEDVGTDYPDAFPNSTVATFGRWRAPEPPRMPSKCRRGWRGPRSAAPVPSHR